MGDTRFESTTFNFKTDKSHPVKSEIASKNATPTNEVHTAHSKSEVVSHTVSEDLTTTSKRHSRSDSAMAGGRKPKRPPARGAWLGVGEATRVTRGVIQALHTCIEAKGTDHRSEAAKKKDVTSPQKERADREAAVARGVARLHQHDYGYMLRHWRHQGVDCAHLLILADLPKVLEAFLLGLPEDAVPETTPWAHLAALLNRAHCLKVLVECLPHTYFRTSPHDTSHTLRLPQVYHSALTVKPPGEALTSELYDQVKAKLDRRLFEKPFDFYEGEVTESSEEEDVIPDPAVALPERRKSRQSGLSLRKSKFSRSVTQDADSRDSITALTAQKSSTNRPFFADEDSAVIKLAKEVNKEVLNNASKVILKDYLSKELLVSSEKIDSHGSVLEEGCPMEVKNSGQMGATLNESNNSTNYKQSEDCKISSNDSYLENFRRNRSNCFQKHTVLPGINTNNANIRTKVDVSSKKPRQKNKSYRNATTNKQSSDSTTKANIKDIVQTCSEAFVDSTPLDIAVRFMSKDCFPVLTGALASPGLLALAAKEGRSETLLHVLNLHKEGSPVPVEDFELAVYTALEARNKELLALLLSSYGFLKFSTTTRPLFHGQSILNVMFILSSRKDFNLEILPNLTRICIQSKLLFSAYQSDKLGRRVVLTQHLFTLVPAVFARPSKERLRVYLHCLQSLLLAGAALFLPAAKAGEPDDGACLTYFHPYDEMVATFQKNSFTSIIDAIFGSASEVQSCNPACQARLTKTINEVLSCITAQDNFQSLSDKKTRDVISATAEKKEILFEYAKYAHQLPVNGKTISILLDVGADPNHEMNQKYAVSVFLENIIKPLRKEFNEELTGTLAKVDSLMALCKAMRVDDLRVALKAYMHDNCAETNIQAQAVGRYFTYHAALIVVNTPVNRRTRGVVRGTLF